MEVYDQPLSRVGFSMILTMRMSHVGRGTITLKMMIPAVTSGTGKNRSLFKSFPYIPGDIVTTSVPLLRTWVESSMLSSCGTGVP